MILVARLSQLFRGLFRDFYITLDLTLLMTCNRQIIFLIVKSISREP
jgi:hypothetical protein